MLDHYSAAAVEAHLRAVGDPMLDAVPAELVGSVFCDSLEVYGADWTTDAAGRVRPPAGLRRPPRAVPAHRRRTRRRPSPRRLPPHPGRAVRGELRRRLPALGGRPRRTVPDPELRDAARDDQQLPIRRPVRGRGVGLDGRSPRPGGRPQPRTSTGVHVVSAEIWTWVHSPSFRATPLDLKGEAHEHLLNGINQLIGHGWPYSPTRCARTGLVLLRLRCAR